MKREIDGRIYDTASATLVASQESGSTHVHRAKSLYRSADDDYFVVEEREVHGVDGAMMTPLTADMARTWLEEHGRADLIAGLFGGDSVPVTLAIDGALFGRVEAAAKAAGLSNGALITTLLAAALPGTPEGDAPARPGAASGGKDPA